MIKFLHDWLPIIIAALSLTMSIITNKKNSKQNCEYREKQLISKNKKLIVVFFCRNLSVGNYQLW